MARDEFPTPIKRRLGERAAYFCTNPDCRVVTIGPGEHAEDAVKRGVAAHIAAAAPGGPRFAPTQSLEARMSIENGIWLCHNCSDLVDGDELAFSAELLQAWKRQHADWVLSQQLPPKPPAFELRPIQGLRPPDGAAVTITADHVKIFRQHDLRITNDASTDIELVEVRVQFPEVAIVALEDDRRAWKSRQPGRVLASL